MKQGPNPENREPKPENSEREISALGSRPSDLQLTDTLCTSCGLCCDGVLFTSVICPTATEALRMEGLGSPVEMKKGLASFTQPCNHLGGTRCSVYADRPGRCRSFECKVLLSVRAGDNTVEQAETIIAETKAAADQLRSQLAELGNTETGIALAYRCDQVMDNPTGKTDDWWGTYAEFNLHLRRMQALLRRHFYEAIIDPKPD